MIQMLTQPSRDGSLTQRDDSTNLGIAPGLVKSYIERQSQISDGPKRVIFSSHSMTLRFRNMRESTLRENTWKI